MAANQRQTNTNDAGGVAARMCSINPTGLVFISSRRFEVSSELGLTIETSVLGITREWSVKGWVVESRIVRGEEGLEFQVTLLFSDLPNGLQQLFTLAEKAGVRPYPPASGAEIFGLN